MALQYLVFHMPLAFFRHAPQLRVAYLGGQCLQTRRQSVPPWETDHRNDEATASILDTEWTAEILLCDLQVGSN